MTRQAETNPCKLVPQHLADQLKRITLNTSSSFAEVKFTFGKRSSTISSKWAHLIRFSSILSKSITQLNFFLISSA